MRKNISNILWGVLFIFVGIGVFGEIANLWEFSLFFDGWWTLFLIVPAFISIVQSGFKVGNMVIMLIGILLLLDRQKVIPNGLVFKAAAPAVLIIIGVTILSKSFTKKTERVSSDNNKKFNNVSEDCPSYVAVFSGNTIKNHSLNFLGGSVTSIFGGNEIDLSDVCLNEDVDFYITSIFGGTEIKAPKNAKIEMHGFPIFGGNENTAVSSSDPQEKKIVFHCTSIFGGTEIK